MHICVPSCLTLNPKAYFYVEESDNICTRSCAGIDGHTFVSSDVLHPKCIAECNDGEFIDDLT